MAIYLVKYKAERKTFGNVMQRVFRNVTARRMVKTNQDIIGKQCTSNDDDVSAVIDGDKKSA